jgi:ATP-dependent DNA ligase
VCHAPTEPNVTAAGWNDTWAESALAEGSAWAFTQKVDGERRLIVIEDGVIAYGRNGNKTNVPEHLKRSFRRLPAGRFILDGS